MNRLLEGLLHIFDVFSRPVARLNMAGKTEEKTKVGGMCGMTVFALITWFLVVRIKKLVNRDGPILTEFTQGINLMAKETPSFNFEKHKFQLGFSILGIK